jgi:hypothetical protein
MLVETQYLTNTKKLVVSYVDKSGDIKLKILRLGQSMKFILLVMIQMYKSIQI